MGAIINIFKSIIGLITGLFRKKQAATAVDGQPAQTKQVKGKKGKDGFYMEAIDLPPAPAAVAPPVAAPSAVTETAPAPKGGVPKKAAKGKAGQAAAAAAVAVATAVTAAPKPVDAVDLIRSALAASQVTSAQAQAQAQPSFAEMNAVPMSNGNRRRPGANMTGFLDLAKTMGKR
jgi:hypothetical protein